MVAAVSDFLTSEFKSSIDRNEGLIVYFVTGSLQTCLEWLDWCGSCFMRVFRVKEIEESFMVQIDRGRSSTLLKCWPGTFLFQALYEWH